MKTDDELKKIAIDIVDGKIFSDRNIENPRDLAMTFMPIALGAFKDKTKEELEDIGLIFEYLDQAGPRSINGLPNFFSFQMLNKQEYDRMYIFYKEYSELKEKFMTKEKGDTDGGNNA